MPTPNPQTKFTYEDYQLFPDDGKRYEIIDGELYVSKQPHLYHQFVCDNVLFKVKQWSDQSGNGRAVAARGIDRVADGQKRARAVAQPRRRSFHRHDDRRARGAAARRSAPAGG